MFLIKPIVFTELCIADEEVILQYY